MTALKSNSNMFSSVAAAVAAVSSCANNSVATGAALAVPFFVAISIICIIMNIAIIGLALIALIIAIIYCKGYSCKSKQQNTAA